MNPYQQNRWRPAVFGLVSSLLASSILAQSGELDTVLISGDAEAATVAGGPQTVTVLDGDDLTAQRVLTLEDALESIEGLQLRRLHGTEGVEVTLQGMTGDQVAVMINGMPLAASTGSTVNLSRVDLNQVERIEIIRGATSALHGSNAMGGVVNLVVSEPDVEPAATLRWQGLSWPGQSSAVAGLGVMGQQTLTAKGVSGQKGAWRHQLGATLTQAFGSDRESRTRTQDTGQGVRLGLDYQARRKLEAGRLGFGTEVDWTHLERPVNEQPSDTPMNHGDRTLQFAVSLDWERPSRLRGLGAESSTRVRLSRFHQVTQQDAVRTGRVDQERDATLWQSTLIQQWDALVGDHMLTLGAQLETEWLDQTQTRRPTSGGTQTTTEIDAKRRQAVALYIQDDLFPRADLEVMPGLRAQWDTGFGMFVAPKLATRWDPEWLQGGVWKGHLRAAVGVGYRVPNLKERHYYFDHSQFGYRVEGNEDLTPEHNLSWQVGSELRSERWQLDLSAYLNQARDLIVSDLEGRDSGVDIYRYKNIDRATIMGGHAGLTVALGAGLSTSVGYDLTHARNDSTDKALPGRTPQVTSAGLRLQRGPWQGSLTARHFSATWYDAENTGETPAWTSLDTVLNRDIGKALTLFAGADNLLDRVQPLSSDEGDQRPLIGRQFYAGIEGRI